MIDEDPLINTGIGKILVSEARKYFRSEIERTPTITEPRNTTVLLSILRAFPAMVQKYSALEVIKDFKSNTHLFNFETAMTLLREARMIAYAPYNEEPGEWVCFGDFSRNEFGQQCQYGSRYLHGRDPQCPKLLDDDSMMRGDPFDYHSIRIHIDALPGLLAKFREHRSR